MVDYLEPLYICWFTADFLSLLLDLDFGYLISKFHHYLLFSIYEFLLPLGGKSVNITVRLEIFSSEQFHCIFSVERLLCKLNS